MCWSIIDVVYNAKLYDFIENQKIEGIVVGIVLWAREIANNYVFMYPKEIDVALVISLNNYPAK